MKATKASAPSTSAGPRGSASNGGLMLVQGPAVTQIGTNSITVGNSDISPNQVIFGVPVRTNFGGFVSLGPNSGLDDVTVPSGSSTIVANGAGTLVTIDPLMLPAGPFITFTADQTLANSFIAMPDLYSTTKRALFERGEAVLGGRRYVLSVTVPDVGAHKAQTEQGTTCVLYLHVTDKEGGPAFDVAIPKTRGWSAEVNVGKRGIFYDVDDREYDAVVTHVVRHPVSVFEAALENSATCSTLPAVTE